MNQADPPPEDWVPDEELGKGGTTVDEDDETIKKKREEQKKKMQDPSVWGEKRKRIVRTKKELIRVLKMLQKTVKFNIIAFSDEIKSFSKKGLTKATAANRKKAIAWVEKLTANGLTHTDDALKEAFKDKEVDTIILLSDGAPTHVGGEGRAEWGGHRDSMSIINAIFEWLKNENKFRKVTIHTLGFVGANFEFMEKLARENNGKFKEIP